jgi:predicted acetyltransferase
MAITYGVPEPDEFEAFMAPVFHGFGDPNPNEDDRADERMLWEQPRSIGARDGDEWVGGTGAFTMDLTLPGGAAVPAAGVTMVGVAATHRRRGVLTELMRRQLDDVAAGDEPVAVLTASESLIYGRFGYGLATRGIRMRIDPRHAALRPDVATDVPGRFRFVTVDDARKALPDAYERLRAGRPGTVRRWEAWWETHLFLDRPDDREGGESRGYLVHEDAAGQVDAWASYRIHGSWPERLPSSAVRVDDMWAGDDQVRLALWQVLLGFDLSVEVDLVHGPLDEPLAWALRDPRRLRASELTDWLWLRLLDVPAALSPRRWSAEGVLVVEVADAFRPASGGRFAIEAGDDGSGEVTRTEAEPGLKMGTEELAALALGTVSASALARIGRVQEVVPGSLATADALFRSDVEPYCCTMF